MYSRSYIGTPAQNIPEGYDGVAMREPEMQEKLDTGAPNEETNSASNTPTLNPWEAEGTQNPEEKQESVSAFSPLGSSLGSLFGGIKLPFLSSIKMPKIGTEEILILIAAAYLLFSKLRQTG